MTVSCTLSRDHENGKYSHGQVCKCVRSVITGFLTAVAFKPPSYSPKGDDFYRTTREFPAQKKKCCMVNLIRTKQLVSGGSFRSLVMTH